MCARVCRTLVVGLDLRGLLGVVAREPLDRRLQRHRREPLARQSALHQRQERAHRRQPVHPRRRTLAAQELHAHAHARRMRHSGHDYWAVELGGEQEEYKMSGQWRVIEWGSGQRKENAKLASLWDVGTYEKWDTGLRKP